MKIWDNWPRDSRSIYTKICGFHLGNKKFLFSYEDNFCCKISKLKKKLKFKHTTYFMIYWHKDIMTMSNLREFVADGGDFCFTPFFVKMRSISDKQIPEVPAA